MTEKKLFTRNHIAQMGFIFFALSACASQNSSISPCAAPKLLAESGSESVFATPEQAAEALADASRHNDTAALLQILGPHGKKIINSGDPVADQEGRAKFVAAYDTSHKFDIENDGTEILVVGNEEWPLPLPLKQVAGKDTAEARWQFDTAAGEQEILDRRVGRNEMNVIRISRSYVEAQREYADLMRASNGRNEFAQHFVSTPGKHDGLYWPASTGQAESPLGPLIANARAENYKGGKTNGKRLPYHGYYYKILTKQGPHAAGGTKNYIVNGHMTEGFGLLVFPAKYGDSGIMTFIVDQNGIVFEKNLGPNTITIAKTITEFDPDQSWNVALDQ